MEPDLGDLCEPVAPGLWLVKAKNGGKFPFSFSFLFTGEQNVLLDAGCGADRLERLRSRVPVHRLILSHTHPDHIAAAWRFEGIPIACPAETPAGVSDLHRLATRFTGGGEAAEQWKGFVTSALGMIRPPEPTERYRDGDIVVKRGDLELRALHAPGHCLDHYVFFEERRGILFSSDFDLTSFGPWFGHEESSIEAFRASLRRVRALPVRMVLSSHRGLVRENIAEELRRFEEGFELQREAVVSLLRSAAKPLSLEELIDASPFYRNKLPGVLFMRKFEEWMIRHLLEEALEAGVVVKAEGAGNPGDGVTRYRAAGS